MNYVYASEDCGSDGCESGWTLYLDHSSISPYNQDNKFLNTKRLNDDEDDDGDEDLSMVSDASSGPPHLHEEESNNVVDTNGCFYHYYPENNNNINNNNEHDPLVSVKSKKNREKRRRSGQDKQSSLLDDTASSPLFGFSDKSFGLRRSQENVLEYSQGYSSTQFEFEVRPPYQEQCDFFESTQSGKQLQQNQWFEGKSW